MNTVKQCSTERRLGRRTTRYLAMTACVSAATLGLVASDVHAGSVVHFEGLEDAGWPSNDSSWVNYLGGDVQRVASGHNGITSASGDAHAIVFNLSENPNVFGNSELGALGPYSRLGRALDSFGQGFIVSQDIYLDPTWSDGQGFDFAPSVNRQNNDHLRDFVWHVGVVGNDLLVNASNNSDRGYNAGKLVAGGTQFEVNDAGWYTFQNVFYDNGGVLAVDFNLFDSGGDLLFSMTRSNAADDIATTVGAPRIAWLTYNNIDGLALDNTSLTAVPTPAAGLAGFAMLGLIGTRRPNRRNRQV